MLSNERARRWLGRVLGGLIGGGMVLLADEGRLYQSVATNPVLVMYAVSLIAAGARTGEQVALAPRTRWLATWSGVLAGAVFLGAAAYARGSAWSVVLAHALVGGCMGGVIGRAGVAALRAARPWALGGACFGLLVGVGLAASLAASVIDGMGLLVVSALGFGVGTWFVAATVIAFERTADEKGMQERG